jgi:hypothetical protein
MFAVHWLPVGVVAEMWSPGLGIDKDIITRELQIALYKLEHDYPFHEPINVNPDTLNLPSPDALINRDFIESFHDKELWKLPEFWFKGLPTTGRPGRPTNIDKVMGELQRRHHAGERKDSLAAEARALCLWEQENSPAELHHGQKGMENAIRMAFNTLKRDG